LRGSGSKKLRDRPRSALEAYSWPGNVRELATARGFYVPGSGYNRDTVFTDADGDGIGACIDNSDTDNRAQVKTTGISERLCDGVDNDGDGTVDDGFTACPLDQKRTDAPANRQGVGVNQTDLTELYLSRTDVDAALAGPYGPLVFSRTYNSRRATSDANVGNGWTHSFAIYLKAMPAGDSRYQIQTTSGEMQYFRCDAGTTDRSCVIDDHQPAGKLRRVSSVWYYYPGDGTRYAFSETAILGRQAYTTHLDSAGFVLSTATVHATTDLLSEIQINAASGSQIVAYVTSTPGGGWNRLDTVKYANAAINSIDPYTFVAYNYNATTWNLESVQSSLDGATTLTLANFTYDANDRTLTLKDAAQDLTFVRNSGIQTSVTYNVEATGNPTTVFQHNTYWVGSRSTDFHAGGMAARTSVRDDHGRVTCLESDDSRMTKYDYTSSWAPVRTDLYGKVGDCTSGGVVERQLWHSYGYNTARQSWRPAWTRERSIYSPAAACTGASLPAGCRETKFDYISTTDDRLQWVTETGSTRSTADVVSQQIRKYRTFYFGLDTGQTCDSTDSYAGLPCKTETQSSRLRTGRPFMIAV